MTIKLMDLLEGRTFQIDDSYEYVVRKGKKIRRKKRKPGYKVVNNRYVKISAAEKMKRKRGAKKAARKRKARKAIMKIKRRKSMKRRKAFGL